MPRVKRPLDDLDTLDRQILAYIHTYTLARAYPPGLTDLGDAVGLSISGVQARVKRLKEGGYLGRRARITRAIWVTERGLATLPRTSLEGAQNDGRPSDALGLR